jgi:hypothetical protein
VLGKQTLPVFFDELEAEANSDRAFRVIKLARLASSEGVIFRGGSDHQATEFVARSVLLLHLDPDAGDARPGPQPNGDPRAQADPARGARADARARDRRARQAAPPARDRPVGPLRRDARAYRRALALTGHSGRSADQFGTLLAFADLLLYDGPEPEPEVLHDWAEALKASDLAETADNRSDADEAIEFLTGYPLQLRGGDEPQPISRFIERGLGKGVLAIEDPMSDVAAPGRRSRTTASSWSS